MTTHRLPGITTWEKLSAYTALLLTPFAVVFTASRAVRLTAGLDMQALAPAGGSITHAANKGGRACTAVATGWQFADTL